jgi:hypothetical protein
MYHLINHHAQTIMDSIAPAHVTEYDWLLQNIGTANTEAWRTRYRAFWQMNAARLSPGYCTAYFAALAGAAHDVPTPGHLAHVLYHVPTHGNGRKSLQFSFVTKLLHMTNPQLPIYDSMVAGFYFFEAPARDRPLPERVGKLEAFWAFLGQEYARILNGGLLTIAIQAFRQRLNPQHFTDQKVIDSLIWAFVTLLRNGGLPSSRVVYC